MKRMNLQFFAENKDTDTTDNTDTTGTNTDNTQDNDNTQKTPEEIRAEIEAELEVKYQSEIDKRVQQAVRNNAEKLKKQQEFEKLTETEKIHALLAEKEEEIARYKREKEEADLQLKVRNVLKENGLDDCLSDIIDISKFIGAENADEAIKTKVTTIKSYFDKVSENKLEDFKKEALKGNTPPGVTNQNKQPVTLTKEQFQKMSYKERLELMSTNKELYNQLSKA